MTVALNEMSDEQVLDFCLSGLFGIAAMEWLGDLDFVEDQMLDAEERDDWRGDLTGEQLRRAVGRLYRSGCRSGCQARVTRLRAFCRDWDLLPVDASDAMPLTEALSVYS